MLGFGAFLRPLYVYFATLSTILSNDFYHVCIYFLLATTAVERVYSTVAEVMSCLCAQSMSTENTISGRL